jgi:putative transposase
VSGIADGTGETEKSGGGLCQGVAARDAFMKQWQLDTPVQRMARALEVSRSGFYAWLSRPPTKRAREDERLKVAVRAAHHKTRGTDGAKRIQWELKAEGFEAGRDRIARLRREMGMICKQKRQFKATTQSNHRLPVAENRLLQGFQASAPNEVWHTDLTYIPTGEGWLYLAGVKDPFTGEVIG